jgi:hypothetical protein
MCCSHVTFLAVVITCKIVAADPPSLGTGPSNATTDRASELSRRISELRDELVRSDEDNQSAIRRAVTIKALVELAKSDPKGDSRAMLVKSRAIDRLTQFADTEDAVAPLVELIDCGGEAIERDWPLSPYPAAVALTKIGVPARRYILASLNLPQNSHRLHLMAYVLTELDQGGESPGSEIDVTAFRLRRELKSIASGDEILRNAANARKKNLELMISLVEEPGFRAKHIPSKPK